MAKFLDGAKTDGSSAAVEWPGGTGTFWAWGEFDGVTVVLEASPDGETWFTVSAEIQFTEKSVGAFALGPCKLRATMTGAGEATNIFALV